MSTGGAPAPPELSAIAVAWRAGADLERLLEAWPADERFELIVVDNDPAGAPAVEPPPAKRVLVIRPTANLGFAGGVNRGLQAVDAPLVLLLNPDARPEPGALEALLAGFAAHPEAAGLVPRLVGDDGSRQAAWQLRPLPGAGRLVLQSLFLDTVAGARREPPAGTAVEQPAAAALALRRRVLARIGGLDDGFHPAWFEDVDLARRLAAAGERLLYHPAAVFRHRLGGSLPRLGYGRFLWVYHRNLARYLCLHHGRAWAAAARVLLPVGALLRLAALPLRRPRRAPGRGAAAAGLLGVALGAVSGWRRPAGWRLGLAANAPATASRPGGDGGVAVVVVTHDSATDLRGCLASIAALDPPPLEIVVVDSGSTDRSVELARAADVGGIPLRVLELGANLGFAPAMNRGIDATAAPYVLSLNPDARPEPDYVRRLLARARSHPELRIGALTGRLVRPAGEGGPPLLDACGMRLTWAWRHLDRGSGQVDRGQLDRPERVFGATGAASLYVRRALDDVAVDGTPFDPDFHSFREDAELAFRLQERGWEVLYEPAARAVHRRFNLPERRSRMPAHVNLHSLKNRYLLRAYHQGAVNLVYTLLPTLARDLAAFVYVLARERTSLAAYGWLWRNRRRIAARRRLLRSRRAIRGWRVERWFLRRGIAL